MKKLFDLLAPIAIAAAALLAIYHVAVVQPLVAELGAEARGSGVARFNTEVQFQNDVTMQADANVDGDLTVVGDIAAASIVTDGQASLVDLQTTYNITVGQDLQVAGVTNLVGNVSSSTGAVTVTDSLDVSDTLSLNGVSFSGPIKYGVSADAGNGTSILHGFATTPTACIVSGSAGITATTGTITETRFSIHAPGTVTVYWACGR